MPRFVVCVPSGSPDPSVAPCADADGISYVPTVVELPAYGAVSFDGFPELFAFSFVAVVSFWIVGAGIGAVLSFIRDGAS